MEATLLQIADRDNVVLNTLYIKRGMPARDSEMLSSLQLGFRIPSSHSV